MSETRGRPQKKAGDRREIRFQVRLSSSELALIERAAEGKPSTWARDILIKAAKKRTRS